MFIVIKWGIVKSLDWIVILFIMKFLYFWGIRFFGVEFFFLNGIILLFVDLFEIFYLYSVFINLCDKWYIVVGVLVFYIGYIFNILFIVVKVYG